MGAIPDWAWRMVPERARSPVRRLAYAVLPESVCRWLSKRRYQLADKYLAGLFGIEIGGGAHNPFYVKAFNVDRYASMSTIYKNEERRLAGSALQVDIVAQGDELPLRDKSVDFVLASHVVEHFPDPIKALLEWERIARRYVFLVVPHRDRTFDAGRSLTTVDELLERHEAGLKSSEDRHWAVWRCDSFVELCHRIDLKVIETEDPDRKVGNGFAVVLDTSGRRSRMHSDGGGDV